MKVESLLLTRRCNQGCAFCSRVAPDSTDPPFAALRDRIVEAASTGCQTLVFTGGEPLLRADLVQLVRIARANGHAVELESNATLITKENAAALRDAGVSTVQVSVVTTRAEAHRSLVGPRTSPRHVFRGITTCLEAGLSVRIRLPVAQGLPSPAARLAGLRRAYPTIERYELAIVGGSEPTVRPEAALDLRELTTQLDEAVREAQSLGVTLGVSPDNPLVPCVHPMTGRAARLFERILLRGDRAQRNEACSACAECALASRCTATSEQVRSTSYGQSLSPIRDARPYLRPGKSPGSRLHVLRAAEVEAFYHVDYEYGIEVERATSRVGVIYRCNQVCTFCELADMDVDLSAEKIRSAIDESRRRGSRRLILTGGEPTLSPHLEEYIGYAREVGFERIELQTNAVLLDKPGAAARLRAAGLTHAQVSLHGPDSHKSDALTAAPGTHQRTLKGVDELLAAGVHVLLNHLVFKDVADLLLDFVRLAEKRWGQYASHVTIQFHSPRNEFATREEALRHLARYSDYAPMLCAAVDRAKATGFHVHDLQDPTGIPSLCVLAANPAYLGPILAQAEAPRLHRWESDWMTRVQACASCDLAHACMGVPKHYVALFGEGEFTPIRIGTTRPTDPAARPASPE